MIELIHPSNIEFLFKKNVNYEIDIEDIAFYCTPLYCAGEVYISTIVDTLTC